MHLGMSNGEKGMKKIWALVCIFMILMISGCTDKKADLPETPSSYEEIECVQTKKFKKVYLSCEQYKGLLRILIPQEWNLEKNGSGYNITKESEQIGTILIYDDGNTADDGSCVFTEEYNNPGVNMIHNINKIESDKDVNFRHSVQYSFNDVDGTARKIEINTQYKELDSNGVMKVMEYAQVVESSTNPNFNVMSLTDSRKKILILGNSFIGTSEIRSTLQQMCGSSLTVEAVSVGMAQVYKYVDDGSWIKKIREGNYSAVFMCGFYGNTKNVDAFKTVINACETSNTKLAIFPAHNENREMIDTVSLISSYPILLDWKNEIELLIAQGINYYDFCVNDTYNHSTPLAGYVGAHMIYRAIFGKVPSVRNFSNVTQSQISKLKDYSSTGSIAFIDESLIYNMY